MPQDHRARQERAQTELTRKMVRWTAVVGIFTVVLAVVSILTGGFVWWQASTAAMVATDTREQLRAMVTMPQTGIFIPDDIEKPGAVVSLIPTFQNFGGTRTALFRAHISLKFFEGGVPANLDLEKPYLEREFGDSVIGPNSTYQGFGVSMPASDLKRAKENLGQVLYWGVAEWSDIFNSKTIHKIRYCNLLIPQNDQSGKLVVQHLPYRASCNKSD